MAKTHQPMPWNSVTLQEPLTSGLHSTSLTQRIALNRNYMLKLKTANLLQNHYQQAGLWNPAQQPQDCHWGWESPTSQVRGQFLGHWLSAAARTFATTGDAELKGKADFIISELGRCQRENGGEWVGSVPAEYLEWIVRGKRVWATHYVLHKTLMGLYEMFEFGQNEQALEILERWANWFHRWTAQFAREQMDDILDVETGGMLEVWANLYGVTGKQEHLDLIERYTRPRLFDRLLAGEDVLTNRHANTTIPEIHGAARAWEVTGERRWRDIVEAYWRCAVTERGYYCTGGQTNNEMWCPPQQLAGFLGPFNQEFCTVYNMMRLAHYLFTWTGGASYADYYERNLYNGILAQQNSGTGMVTYYLPLEAGGKKTWGSETNHFWCCHGTLVQAYSSHGRDIYFATDDGLVVSQYIPSRLEWHYRDVAVTAQLDSKTPSLGALSPQQGQWRERKQLAFTLDIDCAQPVEFELKIRLPWWLAGEPVIEINGERQHVSNAPSSFYAVRRTWQHDQVRLIFPKALTSVALPDAPDTVAFMDGPIVLAGLCDHAHTLYGSKDQPETMLASHNERRWDQQWRSGYQTKLQEQSTRFLPLCDVVDEQYTLYFPVQERA